MTPQALIFDCDGTLADTMPLHWMAWQGISRKHGLHYPEDRFYANGGIPTRDIIRMLVVEQDLSIDPVAVAHEKEAAFLALLDDVRPVSKVVEIAREHHEKVPMAVASGGTRKVIVQILERLRIRHFFHAIVTSEDVVRQKPAPDIFLEAARRLGVEPRFCRAFEDTDLGMRAIVDAGMDAVDVRHHTRGK